MVHPDVVVMNPGLAVWAEKQPDTIRWAAYKVLLALWMVRANTPDQGNLDELARYTCELANAKRLSIG